MTLHLVHEDELLRRIVSVAELPAFDLQLFSAEDEGRTEDPTEKRIREAREKGQVAKSEEFPQAFVVIVGVLTMFFTGSWIYQRLAKLMVHYLDNFGSFSLTPKTLTIEGARMLETMAAILLPVFVMCMIAAVAANIFQVGFQFTLHPIRFDITKINWNPGKILFSKRVAFNLLKSILKIAIIGLASYLIISSEFDKVLMTPDISIAASMHEILYIAFKIIMWSLVLMVLLAIPDYMFQRSEHMESLKMSKQDIKQEHKEQMGDPHIKARLKEMQRQMISRNMIRQVPKADVIVTNPTHYAVALQWERDKADAPAVIAKGTDYVALKIREIARENDVMIIENRPLAREMYARLEVGDLIPEDLFRAVAEVYQILYKEGRLRSVI